MSAACSCLLFVEVKRFCSLKFSRLCVLFAPAFVACGVSLVVLKGCGDFGLTLAVELLCTLTLFIVVYSLVFGGMFLALFGRVVEFQDLWSRFGSLKFSRIRLRSHPC